MKNYKLNQFLSDADELVKDAARGDFFSISTDSGEAVVINAEEYKMLCDAMKLCLVHPEIIDKH